MLLFVWRCIARKCFNMSVDGNGETERLKRIGPNPNFIEMNGSAARKLSVQVPLTSVRSGVGSPRPH